MSREIKLIQWNGQLEADMRRMIQLAFAEDLDGGVDWTTAALIPSNSRASAVVVARQAGVVAGLAAGNLILSEMDYQAQWTAAVSDGTRVAKEDVLARLDGNARDLLTLERSLLNILSHLSGIATLTAEFVRRVAGTRAAVFDTRKTLPGWRRLDKYAVHCGGGNNHRVGLHDAILIKDNHLCQLRKDGPVSPAEAIRRTRAFLAAEMPAGEPMVLEVEIDSLVPLRSVLDERPDIVLLDNFKLDDLIAAVELRNRLARTVQLEASGGVSLATISAIAATGVDRISVGALTHSAPGFDVALDWIPT